MDSRLRGNYIFVIFTNLPEIIPIVIKICAFVISSEGCKAAVVEKSGCEGELLYLDYLCLIQLVNVRPSSSCVVLPIVLFT
jgi:hypothetical protein